MSVLTGASPSHKREHRPTLSLGWKRHPDVVHCGEQDHDSGNAPETQLLTAAERFEAALWADRNEWSIRQAGLGRARYRSLSKREAEEVLRRELAVALSIERSLVPNALARGGAR